MHITNTNNKYIFDTRQELAKYILPKHGIGCEIGVGSGDFAEILFNETKPQNLYLIDRWLHIPYLDPTVYGWKCKHTQAHYDHFYRQTINRFAKYSNVIIIKKESLEALSTFNNHFFDYIYIDASHDYASVIQDLEASRPKIKNGGFICGHDYNQNFNVGRKQEYGVIKAVDEFVNKYGLKIDVTKKDHRGKSYVLYS